MPTFTYRLVILADDQHEAEADIYRWNMSQDAPVVVRCDLDGVDYG